MQMDGKRMDRDGEVGEWVGRVEGEVVQLTCCNVCMYVCTLSPLSLPWRAASAAGIQTDRLGIEVVYRHRQHIIIPPLQLLSVHRSSGFHARYSW